MDKKKTLEAVFSLLVVIGLLVGAGASYDNHITLTIALIVVAFIYASKQIKELGK